MKATRITRDGRLAKKKQQLQKEKEEEEEQNSRDADENNHRKKIYLSLSGRTLTPTDTVVDSAPP